VAKNDADRLLKECDVQYDWLYNDGASTTKSEYQKRTEALRQQGDPIYRRYNDSVHTPEAV